ncbi:hypothetical protein AGMMS50229_15740 [Campylobacterota bacterium]|nr:hypothetical protein AGMMS50229_15740 [Campylobacterota bacterium]
MKAAPIALGLIGMLAFADTVLVSPSDRDRVIKLNDGRQVRLSAGSELVYTDDGKLITRRLNPNAAAPTQARQQPSLRTSQPPVITSAAESTGERWRYFAGAEGAIASVSRSYSDSYSVDNSAFREAVEGDRDSTSSTEFAFGVVAGIKDAQEENLYQFAVYFGDVTELVASAQIGLTSLTFADRFVPFVKAQLGYSFDKESALGYGIGAGVTYPFSPNVDLYGGLDFYLRSWNDVSGSGYNGGSQIGTYKTSQDDTEIRLFVGARYLF